MVEKKALVNEGNYWPTKNNHTSPGFFLVSKYVNLKYMTYSLNCTMVQCSQKTEASPHFGGKFQQLFDRANKYYCFFLALDLSSLRAGQRVRAGPEGPDPSPPRWKPRAGTASPGTPRPGRPLIRQRGARWRRDRAAPPSLPAAPGGLTGPAAAATRPRHLGAAARPPQPRRRAARGRGVTWEPRAPRARAALPSLRCRSLAGGGAGAAAAPARRPLPGPAPGGPAPLPLLPQPRGCRPGSRGASHRITG